VVTDLGLTTIILESNASVVKISFIIVKFKPMKVLKWIAYISAGIGLMLILIGVFSVLTLKHRLDAIYIASYFLGANSFLLITTVILLFVHSSHHKKE
jgi:hypothetical protein